MLLYCLLALFQMKSLLSFLSFVFLMKYVSPSLRYSFYGCKHFDYDVPCNRIFPPLCVFLLLRSLNFFRSVDLQFASDLENFWPFLQIFLCLPSTLGIPITYLLGQLKLLFRSLMKVFFILFDLFHLSSSFLDSFYCCLQFFSMQIDFSPYCRIYFSASLHACFLDARNYKFCLFSAEYLCNPLYIPEFCPDIQLSYLETV